MVRLVQFDWPSTMPTTCADLALNGSKFFDRPAGAQPKKQQSTLAFKGSPPTKTESKRNTKSKGRPKPGEGEKPKVENESDVEGDVAMVDGDTTGTNGTTDHGNATETSPMEVDGTNGETGTSMNGILLNFHFQYYDISRIVYRCTVAYNALAIRDDELKP